jgi:hypothetical protein
MATITGNILTSGLRGKIGKLLVFRRVRGKTIVSHAPARPDKRKETAAQRKTRLTFKEASRWAKIALLHPQQKVFYQQRARTWKLPNAYTAAIKDYMRNSGSKPMANHSGNNAAVTICAQRPSENNLSQGAGLSRHSRGWKSSTARANGNPLVISDSRRILACNIIVDETTQGHDLIIRGQLSNVLSWPRDIPIDAN